MKKVILASYLIGIGLTVLLGYLDVKLVNWIVDMIPNGDWFKLVSTLTLVLNILFIGPIVLLPTFIVLGTHMTSNENN